MKILVDTNVILDVWLRREPFWQDSAKVLSSVESGELIGLLCPTTVTTLHSLGHKTLGETKARELIAQLLSLFELGELTKEVFDCALGSEIADFEDAVLEAVAMQSKVECIVTRNIRDFRKSRVSAKEPQEILS